MDTHYDIIIIGGGPIGLACAIEAKRENLSYLILEKGCLANSLYNYPQGMTFFSTPEKLEIGEVPFVTTNLKPVRAEALEYYRRVSEHFDLQIHLFEEVLAAEKRNGLFKTTTNKSTYFSKKIIVATGFYDIPILLDIPGENLPKVFHYYKDPHYFANQKVVVVGASNSSVDAALETFRKGAEVTMVIRGQEIGRRVKYWVKPDIENRIADGEIKVMFSSSLTAIREDEVDIETPQGKKTIQNDFVLALTGYQPNFNFLEKLGIEYEDQTIKNPCHNKETMETNVDGMYLAGVVCGGLQTHLWFIENSRIHAKKIIKHIINSYD
ncbi:MAG TPA: YpdA family putative bacillithiol disulfide reductase [Sphingobacteriaceae bacterium]|nr:YpdA family putative bacillithiol disulfide reductase [Sphingobacteriaceae bacterium]